LKPLIFDQLHDLHYVRGRYRQAAEYFSSAQKIRREAAREPYVSAVNILEELKKITPSKRNKLNPDIFDTLNDQSHLCEYLDAKNQARTILERTLAAAIVLVPADQRILGRTYKNLAHVLSDQNEVKAARENYEKALRIRRRSPGFYDLDLVVTLEDAARLDLRMRNYDEAHRYLDEAIELMKNNQNINNPITAYLHVLRAQVFQAAYEYENLTSELQEARTIYDQIPILDNKTCAEKAVCLSLVAQSLLLRSETESDVKQTFLEAITLFEQSREKDNQEFLFALTALAKAYLKDDERAGALLADTERANNLTRAYPLLKRSQAIADRLPKWQTEQVIVQINQLLKEYETKAQKYLQTMNADMHLERR